MSRSDLPTSRVEAAPTLLVIGCSTALGRRCRDAAIQAQTLVVETDVASAPTLAAQTRPLAMVMLDDVYSFDPPFFMALASDVRSRLILLPDENVPQPELESLILGAIGEADAARESWRRDSF
ncbi:MAG TPA: hypothetical protein VHB21_25275 [Minicystis sp.]|nr:hypothetical protein [Minicystis sp.]